MPGHPQVGQRKQRHRMGEISPDLLFLDVQQVGDLLDICLVGGRDRSRVHQPGVCIDRNERLHAEVPLVALFGLMHLGVALAASVLGRAGRGNNGGVHDAAASEEQALFG